MITDSELKQKVLDVSLSKDCWYPVAKTQELKIGKILKVTLFDENYVLFYKDNHFSIVALEDRCAHRHIPLSEFGQLKGRQIVCGYHGWTYDFAGKCTDIPLHPEGVKSFKKPPCIKSFLCQEKYGILWLFPGNQSLAAQTPLPQVATLEQTNTKIGYTILDEIFHAHHSQVIENFCDLYHEKLHERYQPFNNSCLMDWKITENGLNILYKTQFSKGLFLKHFLKDFKSEVNVELRYEYPHLSLHFEGQQELWIFLQPISAQKTRVLAFFLPQFIIPFTNKRMPYIATQFMTAIFTSLYSKTFTNEDHMVLEAEAKVARKHSTKPYYEVNAVIPALRKLLIERSN